jgi:signal transduction histidine kinase
MSHFTHELNNLLTVIQGFAELAQTRLTPDDPARKDIEEVLAASAKAIRLVDEFGAAEKGIAPFSSRERD